MRELVYFRRKKNLVLIGFQIVVTEESVSPDSPSEAAWKNEGVPHTASVRVTERN